MKFKIKETGTIVTSENGMYFAHPSETYFSIQDLKTLGLTLEEVKPEPKKLYAYREHCGNGIYTNQIFFLSDEMDSSLTNRAPEYDIIYGDEK